jgi:cell division protein FtsL
MIRRLPSKQRNALIAREHDRDALLRLGLLLVCGLGLASGFVYAGRQHFAALKYGYETENLRRERDELVEAQRRFLVQREEAASPVRLERAARELGMQPLQPAQVDPLRQPKQNSLKTIEVAGRPEKGKPGDVQTKSKAGNKSTNRALNKPI